MAGGRGSGCSLLRTGSQKRKEAIGYGRGGKAVGYGCMHGSAVGCNITAGGAFGKLCIYGRGYGFGVVGTQRAQRSIRDDVRLPAVRGGDRTCAAGYAFDAASSSETRLVFLRPEKAAR